MSDQKTQSNTSSLDDFVDIFELLGNWDQRYQYIAELGEKLDVMPESLKTQENLVKGCMSKVWVSAYRDSQDATLIQYHGDSDSSIIKGILAVLINLTAGKTVHDIEQLDLDELFVRLKLDKHLSPNRHVGVYAIVALMKKQAHEFQSLH